MMLGLALRIFNLGRYLRERAARRLAAGAMVVKSWWLWIRA